MLALGEEFLLCAMQARNLTSLSVGPKTFSGYVLQVRDTGEFLATAVPVASHSGHPHPPRLIPAKSKK
jgi:hypothetical protein